MAVLAAGLPFAALPAHAAVTDASCAKSGLQHVFGTEQGIDYSDTYEIVAKSPPSDVSVTSYWVCSNFQQQTGVSALIFTSTLYADWPSGMSGSRLLAGACAGGNIYTPDGSGWWPVPMASFGATPNLDTSNHRIVCSWSVPTLYLSNGGRYRFEVGERLTYDWEAPGASTSYPFTGRLDVYANAILASGHWHPVCYETLPVPGLSCGGLL
jgi:hypothetical protein